MPQSNLYGRAYEYACLMAIYNELQKHTNVEIIHNKEFYNNES